MSDSVLQDCLKSLSFHDIHARKTSIRIAHPETCDWLFLTDMFQQWQSTEGLESFNGVFWIKGKPGVGKSTLMKHLLLHLEKGGKYLIAAHFFNARGDALEKSCLGMLRSLVYQLLKLDSKGLLWRRFRGIYEEKVMVNGRRIVEWTKDDLEDFLLRHIPSCELSRPLLILVDALDECNEKEVRDMVEFLENLSHKARHGAASPTLRLRIGLSSRHYPEISMRHRIELIVEKLPGHDNDIRTYIDDKLNTDDWEIRSGVIRRSSGIFMWVVLVVKLLNEAYDRGQVQLMCKRLEEIPADLEELFEQILIKENEDLDSTVLTLQLVLFCRTHEPLAARELYFGVISGTHPDSLGSLLRTGISDEAIKKAIKSWSKGLVECYESWPSWDDMDQQSRIRFIHQSVNDFLLRNGRLGKLSPGLSTNPVGLSHDRLKGCCLRYLECPEIPIDPVRFPAFPLNRAVEHVIQALSNKYPFLEYASTNLFFHAEKAHKLGVSQEHFLRQLCVEHDALSDMTRRHKMFYFSFQYRCHGTITFETAVKFQYTFRELLATSQCQFWALLETETRINLPYFLFVYGALKGELNILFGVLLGITSAPSLEQQGGLLDTLLQAASAAGTHEIVRTLVDKGVQLDLTGGAYGTALQAAIAQKHVKLAGFLLDVGADVNIQGGMYGNALQAAVAVGDEDMVLRLLSLDANVNAQGGKYGSALEAAVVRWDQSSQIVHLLLDWGADPNITGGLFGSPLQAAVSFGYDDAARLLFQHHAIVNVHGGLNGTPLHIALERRQQDMIERLLERGAGVNFRGRTCPFSLVRHGMWTENWYGFEVRPLWGKKTSIVDETLLHYFAKSQNSNTLRWLLEKGTDVNATSGILGTKLPLGEFMISKDDEEPLSIVTGQTPLHCATMVGTEQLGTVAINIQALLDYRADVTARNARGETALILASSKGLDDAIVMLLQHQSVISQTDYVGNTPLIAAARQGNVNAVKILVEGGAAVNAVNFLGKTALYEAAYRDHPEVIKYLLTLPRSKLELNTRAGLLATKTYIYETDIEYLDVATGSYNVSFNLNKSTISIQRLRMNGGFMSLTVHGDDCGIFVSDLVLDGGFLYLTVLGERPYVCIETLVATGGYCCIQPRGNLTRAARVKVRSLIIKGGNVDVRAMPESLCISDVGVHIHDFEILSGSFQVTGSTDGSPPVVIGARHGFPPEPQPTRTLNEPERVRPYEKGAHKDQEGVQITCYGKPWGNFGELMWIMPEVDMDHGRIVTNPVRYFDHEGGLTAAEITLRKNAFWERYTGRSFGWRPFHEYKEYHIHR